MPKVKPMLATLIDAPFDDPKWLFEIKWDGFRAVSTIQDHEVEMLSRNDLSFNARFAPIVSSLEKIKENVILDGEIVILDEKGRSSFQLMQNYQNTGTGDLRYCVFDLLYLNGEDLRSFPLIKRKELLKKLLSKYSFKNVQYSDHVLADGIAFFEAASKQNLEGIIAKEIDSPYVSLRSRTWVKIKTHLRQEVVIGGFTEPRASRERMGALLVGVYKKGELLYSGHVGGGFTHSLLESVHKKLVPLISQECPFSEKPKTNTPATWVKPKLVCEVSFAEWTKDGRMRQPVFQGLREDKAPKKIKREVPADLSNLDKVYWPKEKITKGDLLSYYESMAPYILPYLKGRPIVLRRFPNGIEGEGFYQKEIGNHPAYIKTVSVEHEERDINYLLIDNVKSLLYAVNLGSIDIHPFLSHAKKLHYPDYCLIDLDPQDVPFSQVIEAAQAFHTLLTDLDVEHYCKTSGGRGLHIFIPLHGKYEFELSKQFAELLTSIVHEQLPKFTSLERSPAKRKNKIYLDYLQNRFGQTVVPPYAVRPKPLATVSCPLKWEEVKQGLDPQAFTIANILKRVEKIGDIFEPVLGKAVNIKKALQRLEK